MANDSNTLRHEVKSGETLGAIAKNHGVTLSVILAANPDIDNPDSIQVGEIILIPTPKASEAPQPTSPVVEPETLASGANPNAILDMFQPSGASAKTAKQDGLSAGVAASEKMAQTDRKRVMLHKEQFEQTARTFALPPALLAAIASRESRGGAVLNSKGEGDGGHGFGIMQVDDRNPFPVIRDGGPAGQPHINQATEILKGKLKAVEQKFPGLTQVEQLEMAVSRYNGGKGLTPPNSDQGTTGGDYMNDVWARARFYARVEQWS
jgi:LysM repeat protein